MKKLCLFATLLLPTLPSLAQGTVWFANRLPGVVDARVTSFSWSGPLLPDARFVAQLFAAPPGGTLVPIGTPIPFMDEPAEARGYWNGESRTIPGIPPGAPADLRVVAWFTGFGATYEEVLATFQGGFGLSAILRVTLGNPASAAIPMQGLQPFEISLSLGYPYLDYPRTPEPSGLVRDPILVGSVSNLRATTLDYWRVQGRGVLQVTNELAYLASTANSSMEIVDVKDPSRPQRVGAYAATGATSVALRGHHALLGTFQFRPIGEFPRGELITVDVSTPTTPRLLGSSSLEGPVNGVAMAGPYACVAGGHAGLLVIDAQDLAHLNQVASLRLGGDAQGIALAGEYALLAERPLSTPTNLVGGGLHIIDLRQPTTPLPAAVIAAGRNVLGVAVAAGHAYAISDQTLLVIDIQDPVRPEVVGQWNTATKGLFSIALAGSQACLATWEGLQVVDVSNPAAPQLVGEHSTAFSPVGLALSGNLVVVADWDALLNFRLGPALALSVSSGAPVLRLTGHIGRSYAIDHTTSLGDAAAWQPLASLTLTNTEQSVRDPDPAAASQRYYRARSSP